jgi:hypothetical protein
MTFDPRSEVPGWRCYRARGDAGEPTWWMATRRRLIHWDMLDGRANTLIADSAEELSAQLAEQDRLDREIGDTDAAHPAPPTAPPQWPPSFLRRRTARRADGLCPPGRATPRFSFHRQFSR